MTHIGIISPPVAGHINPLAALALELIGRGDKITWLHMADVAPLVESQGLHLHTLGYSDHPPGSLPRSLSSLAQLKGTAAIRFTIQAVAHTTEMFCREAPEAIRATGINALLVDQMEPAGGTIAEHLSLPYVTICNALAINREASMPPPFTPWPYRTGLLPRLRNRIGYAVGDRTLSPITKVVAKYRKAWKLPPARSPEDSFSRLAQICQMPREFDFPRTTLPGTFHYVGPLRGQESTAFPWGRLDGRPLVYASLGTLQNQRVAVFRKIAEACSGTGMQLVISHGGGLTAAEGLSLPGDPVVVDYAPQRALLAKASLTITHAGLNTVLDSLACGVPLVAIPITYEQPAIARRIEHARVGRIASLGELEAGSLRRLIQEVTEGVSYRDAARHMARCIALSGGVTRAADVIQEVLNRQQST